MASQQKASHASRNRPSLPMQSNPGLVVDAPPAGAQTAADDMAGRCVLYIAGFDQQSWNDARQYIGQDALIVDTTEALPRDPALNKGKKGKGKGKDKGPARRTVDQVASMDGFTLAVDAVVIAARQSRKVVVQCRRGIHRSPVVGAAAKEVLIMQGYSVAICELSRCQSDIIQEMCNVMEDWHAGRRASAESPASYNNFASQISRPRSRPSRTWTPLASAAARVRFVARLPSHPAQHRILALHPGARFLAPAHPGPHRSCHRRHLHRPLQLEVRHRLGIGHSIATAAGASECAVCIGYILACGGSPATVAA